MIKQTFLAGSALAIALSLGACGDSGSTTPTPPAAPVAPTATPAAPAAPATPDAKSVSAAVTAQADKLISDTSEYIKDNKMDLADKGIKQLEEMKPNLPPEYSPRIDQLRKTFDAAKASGITMPKM